MSRLAQLWIYTPHQMCRRFLVLRDARHSTLFLTVLRQVAHDGPRSLFFFFVLAATQPSLDPGDRHVRCLQTSLPLILAFLFS